MHAITISGWGQKADSLSNLVPKQVISAVHLAYAEYGDAKTLLASLRQSAYPCDILIGWSLGGQLCVRAVAAGIFKPKLLVLIAAPYQFVSGNHFTKAMNGMMFDAFKAGFSMAPSGTMKKFAYMVGEGDSHTRAIMETLEIDEGNHQGWVSWLDELKEFSCDSIDFKGFPRTLILHGDSDKVVDVEQAHLFRDDVKNSRLEIFKKCGHAPHLHDMKKTLKLINEEVGAV